MNSLANVEVRHIDGDDLRQILGKGARFDLKQHVFEHAAIGLDADGFAFGFDRHHDGDFFVFGYFMKIDMKHFAVEGVMLNFLNQRQPFGAGIFLD